MRPIRFKARALGTDNMVEGYYAHQHLANFDADGSHVISYDEQDAIFNDEPGNRNGSHWVRIAPESLCQMTGIDDKDGKPIWEHDIVRMYSHRLRHHIKSDPYHEKTAEVFYVQGCFSIIMEDGNRQTLKRAVSCYDLEVIGNAFIR